MSNLNTELLNIVLITGTSRGIGEYLANHYLSKKYTVIGCSRSAPIITHPNYTHFALDLSDESQIIHMFKEIRKTFARLDILINNAAINPSISPAVLVPMNTILQCFKVNIFAPMIITREACKLMSRKKFGRIINIGSMAAKLKVKGESVYGTTKGALNVYTEIIAKEVYKNNITVNVVAPSAIKTTLSAQIDPQALKDILDQNAIQDFGVMSDVSNTIDWLISKESAAVTGQIIYLGGV